MHTCDSGYLCRYFEIYPMHSVVFYCLKNCSTSDICHLLISGVGVQTEINILCESDRCLMVDPLSYISF